MAVIIRLGPLEGTAVPGSGRIVLFLFFLSWWEQVATTCSCHCEHRYAPTQHDRMKCLRKGEPKFTFLP